MGVEKYLEEQKESPNSDFHFTGKRQYDKGTKVAKHFRVQGIIKRVGKSHYDVEYIYNGKTGKIAIDKMAAYVQDYIAENQSPVSSKQQTSKRKKRSQKKKKRSSSSESVEDLKDEASLSQAFDVGTEQSKGHGIKSNEPDTKDEGTRPQQINSSNESTKSIPSQRHSLLPFGVIATTSSYC
ncbi:predicted protein [Chaetoceros tenuissimus]|uniref:Uncharacterized protein n=1 Tax=Chaetoceros tenuissimus TaxID=426638 RepID=A0AAD3CGD4_9STRA|nr:predicted protein [Chaetoceros tenuissimus]